MRRLKDGWVGEVDGRKAGAGWEVVMGYEMGVWRLRFEEVEGWVGRRGGWKEGGGWKLELRFEMGVLRLRFEEVGGWVGWRGGWKGGWCWIGGGDEVGDGSGLEGWMEGRLVLDRRWR